MKQLTMCNNRTILYLPNKEKENSMINIIKLLAQINNTRVNAKR